MKKIVLFIFVMFLFCLNVEAKKINGDLDNIILNSGISKNSIAISIKDLQTGTSNYSLNEKILMHPASVQKVLTLPAAIDVLGNDYEFSTKLYSNAGKYTIKLGADPYLTSSDLKTLIKGIDSNLINEIFIDPDIIESKDWGEGWQWDDDMNNSMPRFNSYNLDSNLIKITLMPDGNNVAIINPSKYPFNFVNNVKIGDKNNISIKRNYSVSPNTIELSGTLNNSLVISFPQNNLKKYFEIKLKQTLIDRNIYLMEDAKTAKLCGDEKLITEIKHPINKAIEDILKNSNNMVMETVMKLAGAKAYEQTGNDILGTKVFDSYCKSHGIDDSRIRITDASGVSKNNLVDADFITNFLIKSQFNPILSNMATAGEGTLSNRMLPLKGNLMAKTGTLSDISSIAGFLTSKAGNKYVFCIIINDPSSKNSDKKHLEDYLLRELYLKG